MSVVPGEISFFLRQNQSAKEIYEETDKVKDDNRYNSQDD